MSMTGDGRSYVICKICNGSVPKTDFADHLRTAHNLLEMEYARAKVSLRVTVKPTGALPESLAKLWFKHVFPGVTYSG